MRLPIGASSRTPSSVRLPNDHGSVAAELVLLVPLFAVVLLAVVCGGRVMRATTLVREVAATSARAASLARTPSEAQAVAARTAAEGLRGRGPGCATVDVQVDTSGLHPGGSVSVAVTCYARLSDLGLLGVPGERAVRARSTEVVDVRRGGR